MSIEIREVNSKKEFKKFIWFGINLYKNNKYAAPPLFMDDKLNLTKGKNPAMDFCDTIFLLAYKDGKIVGRIAGIVNPEANKAWNQKYARFGWVDFIDDVEVVDALLKAVEKWAKDKGLEAVHGPLGFTDFDHEGTLIEGFDKRGTMVGIYNYPYYPKHFESCGYVKDTDWVEYLIKVPETFPEKYFRMADIVSKKYNLTVKKFKSRRELIKNYSYKIFSLINHTYKHLYGYSNLNKEQIDYYINIYLNFLRLDTICIVVNENDDVVGLGISIPSLTYALQKAKGRIFPTGWFHLLKALLKNDTIDLYLMAIHPDYQNKGVNSLMFAYLMPNYVKNGYRYAESNPELETNIKISAQWDSFEYAQHKRRRVFIKHLK
jgi:GNAT superfamily N-acetyltransferase